MSRVILRNVLNQYPQRGSLVVAKAAQSIITLSTNTRLLHQFVTHYCNAITSHHTAFGNGYRNASLYVNEFNRHTDDKRHLSFGKTAKREMELNVTPSHLKWNYEWDKKALDDRLQDKITFEASVKCKGDTSTTSEEQLIAAYPLTTDDFFNRKTNYSKRHILLVRHGQYSNVYSNDDALQGLTDNGKVQADITGRRLEGILQGRNCVGICYSNLKRARETATIIKKYFPDVSFTENSSLAEGIPSCPEPRRSDSWPTNTDVECDGPRINAAFDQYFYRPMNMTPEKYEILVCHGNVIRYFFCKALQFPLNGWLRLSTYNCGITWITIDDMGFISAREFGNVGHLPANIITYQ